MTQSPILTVLLLVALAAPEGAPLFPLEAGRFWIFQDGSERRVLDSDVGSAGGHATTAEQDPSGFTTEWSWRVDAAGDVWLLGWSVEGNHFLLDIPALWLPANPVKGQEWVNRATILNSGGKPVGLFEQTRLAAGSESLALPWGHVDAMRIESEGDQPGRISASRRDDSPGPDRWVTYFTPGPGIVRRGRDPGVWIDVEGFGADFVPVGSTGTSALKSVFNSATR